MHRMLLQPEVLGCARIAGGDDVPAGPAAAEVVEGREQAGDVVGLRIGGGGRADEADPVRRRRDRRKPGERLQPKAAGVADVVGQRRAVGEEDSVELRGLRPPRELLVVADVEDPFGRGVLVPPTGHVMAGGIDEQVQVDLSPGRGHGWAPGDHLSGKPRRSRTSFRPWRPAIEEGPRVRSRACWVQSFSAMPCSRWKARMRGS